MGTSPSPPLYRCPIPVVTSTTRVPPPYQVTVSRVRAAAAWRGFGTRSPFTRGRPLPAYGGGGANRWASGWGSLTGVSRPGAGGRTGPPRRSRTRNPRRARTGGPGTLPLRQDLAAELRDWLRDKPAGQPHFPVKGNERRAMLWADLRAAGIEPVVEGRVVDIHSLRVTFVSNLARSGVPPATAQKLARHSDPRLTANTYAQLGMRELLDAVESLPSVGGTPPGRSGTAG